MPSDTLTQTTRLVCLLTEALALADAIGLPLAAIHIDEAIAGITQADDPQQA